MHNNTVQSTTPVLAVVSIQLRRSKHVESFRNYRQLQTALTRFLSWINHRTPLIMPDYKFKMSCSLLMAEDLTNSLERGWFVHIFLIGNKQLMDKIYSHCIYLPAYLKLMNVDTIGRLNVHDNNLIITQN